MKSMAERLAVPNRMVDVILDTDTYNEIDDQFALAYYLLNPQRIHPVGICAAPFFNNRSTSPEDGMEKSYQEILKLQKLVDNGKENSCTHSRQ